MEVDEPAKEASNYPRSRSRSRNSQRSPLPPAAGSGASGGGIVLNRPLGYSTLPRSGGMSGMGFGGGGGLAAGMGGAGLAGSAGLGAGGGGPAATQGPGKLFLSTRRSSSGIFITNMFGSRFRHLQKLHSDAFCLGLNAVCFPGLPSGTMFRSSLPATPISTPIHREAFTQFTEQAIRDRLCRTPSPRKNRGFSPLSLQTDDSLNEPMRPASDLNDSAASRCSTRCSDSEPQPMDITCPSTPITEPVFEAAKEEDSPNGEPGFSGASLFRPNPAEGDAPAAAASPLASPPSPNKPPLPPSAGSQRKLFVGNISYRVGDPDPDPDHGGDSDRDA